MEVAAGVATHLPPAPSLIDFLVGPALATSPALQTRVLQHCLATEALPAPYWIHVIAALSSSESCADVVVEAVRKHSGSDMGIKKWAAAARLDKCIPIPLRLRLHLCIEPGGIDLPTALRKEAEDALLACKPIPPEAIALLDAPLLWAEALCRDAHVAAALLVDHVPNACDKASEKLTHFLQRGLIHTKRAQRRACVHVLEATSGQSAAALLSLLAEQQPLHMLQAVDALPPGNLHDAAATLALRYGDSRVHEYILSRLVPSDDAILSSLADFAAARLSIGQGSRPPVWTMRWQERAGLVLRSKSLDALSSVLAKPFPSGSLTVLLRAWEEGWEKGILHEMDPLVAPFCAAPLSLRELRRHAPSLAGRVAEHILRNANLELDNALLVEATLCRPACCSWAESQPGVACTRAVQLCSFTDLPKLAQVVPAAVAERLATADAATALWAIRHLPGAKIDVSEEGFTLRLAAGSCFAPTTWIAARAACMADESLAAAYPQSDPDYSAFRPTLLALGPSASCHASRTDLSILKAWAGAPLSREQRLEWLRAAARLLHQGAADLSETAEAAAVAWAKSASKDSMLVAAALEVLQAMGGGCDHLDAVWGAVRSCNLAEQAIKLLGNAKVSDSLFEKILKSSSLSATLARSRIESGSPEVATLVALAVRAVAATGGGQSAIAHPSIQLCQALLGWAPALRTAIFKQLIDVERPGLQPEGSPKGEPHYRHMRLWLCLGTLLDMQPSLIMEAAPVIEAALKSAAQFPSRVLLQNVWARAAWRSPAVLQRLVEALADASLPEAFAGRCVAVAAQLVLHPSHADLASGSASLDEGSFKPLLAALVGWSCSYVHGPRLLASLALFHALERGSIDVPGWYLNALHQQVAHGPAFQKLRASVQMDRWVSDAWQLLNLPQAQKPLDVAVALGQKHVSGSFWAHEDVAIPIAVDAFQRRPAATYFQADSDECADVVVVGSFLDNLPNMAGLVRTTEALLGPRGEVALHSQSVLSDPSFLKMSVAAERANRLVFVPQGPRLLEYIREKRAAGFSVAALEQTSSSRELCIRTALPKKLMMLIGNEQQGLPVWLVQSGLVDDFYEIPLLGQTGSLNAHVAASMLLWHYRTQH